MTQLLTLQEIPQEYIENKDRAAYMKDDAHDLQNHYISYLTKQIHHKGGLSVGSA